MLRNFEYNPDKKLILEVLSRFNIELPEHIALVRFEVITPDSFFWRILIGDIVYYLYAEDYVPGLAHVKSIFSQYLINDNWSFIEPRTSIKFDDATPVKGVSVYNKADDADAMMQYAIDSGHDFVFLVRSLDDPENAQFSESAPRGFAIGG
jgi:hypothetical protein